MSAPFAGPPRLPLSSQESVAPTNDVHHDLGALQHPRKHYQWYYATREANADICHCAQGLHAFLRAYYHHKSADWPGNKPYPLKAWTAEELAKLPTYYIMDLHKDMAETVAHEMPAPEQITACAWMPDSELGVYTREFQRTGFQGVCNGTAARSAPTFRASLRSFQGGRLMYRRCSFPEQAIGVTTRGQAPSMPCSRQLARACAAVTSCQGPGTGCNKSSPRQ